MVRRAGALLSESILRGVEEEEAKARQEAMHGETITSSGRNGRSFYIEPEQAAKWDAEQPYGRPTRELLRRWCGQEAVARQDELTALRNEVVRVDALLSEAIRTLRDAGLKEQAASLERRFGVPLNEARASRR